MKVLKHPGKNSLIGNLGNVDREEMGLLIREVKVKPMNETQGWVGWMKSVLEDQMYKCVFENK